MLVVVDCKRKVDRGNADYWIIDMYLHNINTNMFCRQFGQGRESVYILSPIFRKTECRFLGIAWCKLDMIAWYNKSYRDPCPQLFNK